MGEIIFILTAIIFFVQILISSGVNKLYWFLVGILFFPRSIIIINSPVISFPRLMIYGLLISFIFQGKQKKSQMQHFPLFKPLMIIFIGLLCIGLMDSRLEFFFKLYRPFSYFLENFLIVFLCYFYLNTIKELKAVFDFIIKCLLVFSLYGFMNYATQISLYSKYISEIYKTVDFGNFYTGLNDSRFRISSFAWHPIYYGLLLGLVILLVIFVYQQKELRMQTNLFYKGIIVLLGINLLWTNSRTPLLAVVGGLVIFYIFALDLRGKLRNLLLALGIAVVGYLVSPNSFQIIEESINTFTSSGSRLEGSSVEMRDMQMEASLLLFSKSPVFGNGFNYITEDLGYSSDEKSSKSDTNLYGFESYSYKLLIEQGLIGIVINLIFFIGLLRFLLKKYSQTNTLGRHMIYFSAGITITFLLFIFGTGDMGGFLFYMSILGLIIKAIMLSLTEDRKEKLDNVIDTALK
jgi:hypothetical protein